jgi:pyruvate/2-oxoacid:ferredoxin oxidoreductase alpha subunit
MMRKFLAVVAFACLTVFGCATKPQTPAQSVYAAQGTYAAALQIAVTYKQLPACVAGGPVLCSDPAAVAKVQEADDVAYDALTAAQNIVRTPGAGLNVQTAITAATQAIAAFDSITATLKVTP